MATMTSKLPTSDRPLIADPDLSAALERMLAPMDGKRLERAQAAVRKVANSAVLGPYAVVLAAYQAAIRAVEKEA
jgi:hypothetical protein